MATQRARFKYKNFKGRPKDDPDEWIEDFVGTAQANGEDGIKMTILAGVLGGEARPWFNALPAATKTDWGAFKATFLHEFRRVGEESEALIKIGQMVMKKGESVSRFLQRFNRLASKIEPAPVDNMKMRWFVSSLPKKMGVSVRQSHPLTLEQAVEVVQSYRSADISSKAVKKKKKRYDSSDSSSSEDEEEDSSLDGESSTSDSEESSSEDERKKKRKSSKKKKKRNYAKRGARPVVPKLKVEVATQPKEKGVEAKVDDLANQLKAMSIHFVRMQSKRMKVPREHVWCVKCGQFGHMPQECANTSMRVHYVGEEQGGCSQGGGPREGDLGNSTA
ncbi:unnamed protein product [Calypogeia fissa]